MWDESKVFQIYVMRKILRCATILTRTLSMSYTIIEASVQCSDVIDRADVV